MNAITDALNIKNNLPEVYEHLTKEILSKINKHKKKDTFPTNTTDWQWSFNWGQRVQGFSFEDVLNGKVPLKPKEPKCVEEKVYNLFKNGDLGVSVCVKNKTINAHVTFPQFSDENFYVPIEIVKAYDYDNAEELDKPTIFIYAKKSEQEAFRESYVIGGLKDIKTNKEYIVVKTLNSPLMAYTVSEKENNLDAFSMLNQNISVSDFDKSKTVKIGRLSYYTQEHEEAMEILKGKNQWIEDSQCLLDMLLGQLSKSPGFMAMGNMKKSKRITNLPFCTNIIYMTKISDPDIFAKFKIR